MKQRFRRFIAYLTRNYNFYRFLFLVFSDLFITFSSLIMAIFISAQMGFTPYSWPIIFTIILITFGVKLFLFIIFQIYNISFQHANILYILKTSSVILIGVLINYPLLKLIFPAYWFFSTSILYGLLEIGGSVGFRFLPLIYYELCNRMGEEQKDSLIYGCGDTGKSLLPILKKNKLRIKGFIDDDAQKLHKVIHGIKVLGRLEDLERILMKTKIDTIIIANSSLAGRKLKDIRQICSEFNIEVKTIPSIYQIYNRDIEKIATSIRSINYEDLIRRPARKENFTDLNSFFKSKKIMVTGAGSIGTELVNQLANLDLQEIIVLDNCELNLFNLGNSIEQRAERKITFKMLDLKNRRLLEKLLAEAKPDFIFHTAAYKHVSLVEENICEGVLNNLLCLKNIYEAARGSGVKRFIFISSDKAVRPTNIMGATKRLGELYIQAKHNAEEMIGSSVRFGNVIGSSGSLVPKVIEQIQQNRVITVTHPQARRFFMLASEAVLLILKAAVIAQGAEIFILDMGKPIKIVDMVKEIINFYGRVPEIDTPIEYIGLRPGEKLFEELMFRGVEDKSYRDGMYIAKAHSFDYTEFINDYNKIISSAGNANGDELFGLLTKYVKLYTNEELLKEKDENIAD